MSQPTRNAANPAAPDDPRQPPAGPQPIAHRWWLLLGLVLAALLAVWRCG